YFLVSLILVSGMVFAGYPEVSFNFDAMVTGDSAFENKVYYRDEQNGIFSIEADGTQSILLGDIGGPIHQNLEIIDDDGTNPQYPVALQEQHGLLLRRGAIDSMNGYFEIVLFDKADSFNPQSYRIPNGLFELNYAIITGIENNLYGGNHWKIEQQGNSSCNADLNPVFAGTDDEVSYSENQGNFCIATALINIFNHDAFRVYYTLDSDNDGIPDEQDVCPLDADNDLDADGICGNEDNCPIISNANQWDADNDGIGNVCDNCPETQNPAQEDENQNGIGNACEIDCPQGTLEEILVPFKTTQNTSTVNNYLGNIQLTLSGVGNSSGKALNDAFYVYTSYRDEQPVIPYVMNPFNLFLWNQSLSEQITLPAYEETHQYTTNLLINSESTLDFKIGDTYIPDNSGYIKACINSFESVCGNEIIEYGEDCETDTGIQCQEGYYCSVNTNCVCVPMPYCGDGNLDEGEECDDGNNENEDGCDEYCLIEPCAMKINYTYYSNQGNGNFLEQTVTENNTFLNEEIIPLNWNDLTLPNNGNVQGIALQRNTASAYFMHYGFQNSGDIEKVNAEVKLINAEIINLTEDTQNRFENHNQFYDKLVQTGINSFDFNLWVNTAGDGFFLEYLCTYPQNPFCGNNILEAQEECETNSDCSEGEYCDACLCYQETPEPYCGDEIINGNEECEFNEDCEEGFECNQCICIEETQGYCGNEIIEEGEQCEFNEDCSEGEYCSECMCIEEVQGYCGDGIVQETEDCDIDSMTQCQDGYSCSVETNCLCVLIQEPICGNEIIEEGEQCEFNEDCGEGFECNNCVCETGTPQLYCGDAICNNGETCSTCPQDCSSCNGGTIGPYCGDGSCNGTETSASCSADCGSPAFESSGSGGSRCIPDLVYSDWSSCINGIQTRTYTNSNDCPVDETSIELEKECQEIVEFTESYRCEDNNPCTKGRWYEKTNSCVFDSVNGIGCYKQGKIGVCQNNECVLPATEEIQKTAEEITETTNTPTGFFGLGDFASALLGLLFLILLILGYAGYRKLSKK
ncbi:MAG: thrombospondin type 3 repeat-containing protein, partial [Candidatus Diapherotrites archaeon]|nr:thrombospondin type 3 repeat-containing protein [Candidatus Diapherotrites archaeon]